VVDAKLIGMHKETDLAVIQNRGDGLAHPFVQQRAAKCSRDS